MSYYTAGTPLLFPPGDMRGSLAAAVQDVAKQTDTQVVNVKSFGAKGDGVTDDRAAIQAAIDYAKTIGVRLRPGSDGYTEDDRLGTVIYLPPGRYMLKSPLVMPRSGLYPAHTVGIIGCDRFSTTLTADTGFPQNRGIIEWESTPRRVFGQVFRGFGLEIDAIVGCKAFHYLPTKLDTQQNIFAESMNWCVFEDLTIISSTLRNQSGIRIEGQVDYSRFLNLIQDSGNPLQPVDPVYSTNLLHFDEAINGVALTEAQRGLDVSGANYCEISGLTQGFRGGWGTLIYGRVGNTRITNVAHGVGAFGSASGIRLKSSGNVTIEGAAFEGLAEDGEILLDSCSDVFLRELGLGITGIAPGVGLKVIDGRRIRWTGRFNAPGIPAFSANGSKMLTVDATTTDSVFEGISSNETFANEVTWQSTGANRNRIEYRNGLTNEITVRDERPGGVSVGSGDPENVITAPVGALYSRIDGGVGSALYVKETGVGNTGWAAK